jgi:hypothetical protein
MYTTSKAAYREIACIVSGPSSSSVAVAAAPTALWARQAARWSAQCRASSRNRSRVRARARQITDKGLPITVTTFSPPRHRTGPWPSAGRRSIIAQASRYIGALAVLATGVAHFEQYTVDDYSTVPTIGTLFLLNFIAAIVIAVGLVVPLGRIAGRYADAVRAVFAVSGIGLGVLSLVALFVSESSGLFGFVEHGYRMAIVSAIVAEAAAAVFLIIFLVANGTGLQKIRRRSLGGV